jgi:WG containing repeat
MKRRVLTTIFWCIATLGISSGRVDASFSRAWAQAPVMAPTTDAADQSVRQGSAEVLLAVRSAALAGALAAEDRAKKQGTTTSVSFPLPTCVFEGGLCGALNRDGTVAVAPQFDWVDRFYEGRARVRSGGLYGYVDTAGRTVAEPKYEFAGAYWRGFAEVSIGGKSALIDPEGRQVLEPRFARAHPFTKDVFWVNEGTRRYDGEPGMAELVNYEDWDVTRDISVEGKWGLVDRTGEWIRRPEFTHIRMFDRNDGNLVRVKADAGWGVIKPDGTWFLEPKFERLGQRGSDLVPVKLGGQFGYIDRAGAIIIEPKFDSAGYFEREGLAVAKIGKLAGLIDRTGAWVVEPKYDLIYFGLPRDKNAIRVMVGEKWGAIDGSGQFIVSPRFDQFDMTICDDGWVIGRSDGKRRVARRDGGPLAMPDGELSAQDCEQPLQIQIGNKFGFLDRKLQPITEVKFDDAAQFVGDVAAVKLDGKFGYIKRDGTWLIEPRFEEARPLGGDFAAVKLDGKFGYVKRDGTWLIEPRFEEIDLFLPVAKLGGKFGYFDKRDGTWLIEPRFEKVVHFGGGFDAAKVDGKFGVIDKSGAWVIEPRWRSFGLNLSNGLVPAKLDDKWGFIDASGALIIAAKYDESSRFRRGINWVKSGSTWCAIDRRGKSVPTLPCQGTNPNPEPGTVSGRSRF